MGRKSAGEHIVSVIASGVLLVAPVSFAQEEQAAPTAQSLNRDGGDMHQLFMTSEQRRLLEAVRQGLLRDEELDRVKEIATARLQQFEEQVQEDIELSEFISFDNPEATREAGRSVSLNLGGFIRIGGESTSLLINGRFVEAESLQALGIDFNRVPDSEAKSAIVGVDVVREKLVVLKPGQTLPGTGRIQEKYVSIRKEGAQQQGAPNVTEGEGDIDIADVVAE